MTFAEIREECWDMANEIGEDDTDRLWPTKQMNRYINRVYKRIASETLCIRDSTTPSICIIPSAPVDYTTYTPGTLDYIWANDSESWLYQQDVSPYLFDLDPSVLRVDEMKWASRSWKLTKVSSQKWKHNPWWEKVKGMPTEYATDLQNRKIAVNFRDELTDNYQLAVRRMPLVLLIADEDVPELRVNYHEFFINGVLEQMYSKQDSEAFDGKKAADHGQMFLEDLDEIKQEESGLDERLRPNFSYGAFR
jgi:hypothetical protein